MVVFTTNLDKHSLRDVNNVCATRAEVQSAIQYLDVERNEEKVIVIDDI